VLTDGQNDVWVSQHIFDTSQQALDAFYFFLILLRYKGNYFIDYYDCDCSGRLYIREILAESVKKFVSEERAWGKEGVEKFICISQSENAFQPYFDSQLCRHSFYVACPDLGLNHPCKYDLPDKRDKSLVSLISSAKSFKLEDLFQIEGKNVSMEEFVNFVFGALEKNSNLQRNQTICMDVIDLATYLSDDSVELPASLQKSKDKLQAFAYFFPVFKKQIPGSNSNDYKYFVEIKYPEICIDTLLDEPPCDCDHKGSTDFDCCCIAWTSDCCFTTCEEALQYYKEVAVCLTDPGNYVQVFDCDCGSYGIRFHCRCEKAINDPTGRINSGESRYPNHCCNEIIAKNPQYYTSPKMDCKAICRAIDLVNCEGIHLVEHILLRPHCVDGDCQCIIDSCGYDNCKFV
ncbi:MAG TPA: hypothetical protein VFV08_15520, partial [Puia sp.]|nr:hypothetical protein [Puia sp.]